MTVVQSIVASRTLMWHGAGRACWPDDSVHTSDDVIVNGTSLVHAARSGATPLVQIGPAGGLWPREATSVPPFITVVLSRVEEIDLSSTPRHPDVWIDAEIARCRPLLSAVRLIGRTSGSPRRRMHLRPGDGSPAGWVRLPADVGRGDLLVIPCAGPPHRAARRRAAGRPSVERRRRRLPLPPVMPQVSSPPSCLGTSVGHAESRRRR